MKRTLTERQAFDAMLDYIRTHNEQGLKETFELIECLDYEVVSEEGIPETADPGEWQCWMNSVSKVLDREA